MSRPTRLVAAGAIALTSLVAAACTEDEPREALQNARYELVDLVDFWGWAPRGHLDMDWDPPSRVEAVAGGGPTDPREAVGDDGEPGDLDLQNAARIHTDDTDGIWVLSYGTVVHINDGTVDRIYDIGTGSEVCAIAVDPEGRLVVTSGTATAVFEPDGGEPHFIRDRSSALRPNALAYQPDGTLVAGGWFDDRLAAVAVDGTDHGLLEAPADPDAALGPLAFVTVLSDGRIVVAPWATEDEMELGVVVDRAVQPVGGSSGQARPPQAITSLAPAPDGRLLVTTPDSIEAVDVDTGESDTLVDLTGAEGTPSAAATGDDLVFLADGRLWRLPDAFS